MVKCRHLPHHFTRWEALANGLYEPGVPRHGWQCKATVNVSSKGLCSRGCWMHREHFCVHKAVLSPACPSPVSLLPLSRVSTPSRSAYFCCVVSGFLCPCPVVPAGVAVHSIPVATTAQPAPWQGCWVQGVSHWSPPKAPGSAEPVRQPQDRSRGWTDCRSSMVPNSPWTRHWSLHCAGMGPRTLDEPTNVDGAGLDTARRRKETTYPEFHGRNGRTRLVVLGAEVGGRWSDESAQFVGQLAKAKARGEPNPPQSGPTGVDTQVVFQRCQVSRIVVAAIIVQFLHGRECWAGVASLWRVWLPGYAGRQEDESAPTCW